MIYGLNHLAENTFKVFSPYGEGNPKSKVKLIYLPAEKRKKDYFVIFLAGGAYGAVCTMVESLPVAARLNELGIDCFCLNYETATTQSFINGLLPAPIDDLAAACKFIFNDSVFNFDSYVVCGFSAGGHIASLWGTAELGARKYGISQPKALMLAYPLITMENALDTPIAKYMCTGMFGKNYDLNKIREFDASRHIDNKYPKTFIVRAKDDTIVSQKDTVDLKIALDKENVPCVIEEALSGGHGFGLGSKTPLCGWEKHAIEYID